MSTYDKLDGLIVDAIKAGSNSFHLIFNRKRVLDEAHRISGATGRDTDRIVDSRLQALRKRGAIKYLHYRGWVALSKEVKC